MDGRKRTSGRCHFQEIRIIKFNKNAFDNNFLSGAFFLLEIFDKKCYNTTRCYMEI